MKRILLLHTGGTLGMMPSGEPMSLAPGHFLDQLLETVPELRRLADLSLEVPFNCDSAAMEPDRIAALATHILSHQAHFDGFIVLHGTDTMAFTASVLGFLLAEIGKPVVLTGSQRPLAFVRTDARSNLINAVDLACQDIPEIGIVFGTRWLRGVASEKRSVHQFDAFESPNLAPLAEIATDIRMHPSAGRFPRNVPHCASALNMDIEVLTAHPGKLWRPLQEGPQAVLIQAFGSGNLPMDRADLQSFLKNCKQRAIPVVVTTQCASGGVDLTAYELGRKLEAAGAISGGLHTRWCALAKLGLCLGMNATEQEIRTAFSTAWAGEPLPFSPWSQA